MKRQEVEMTLTKSTKGTHVYSCDDSAAAVSTVYVKRSALPSQPPQVIKMVIEHE